MRADLFTVQEARDEDDCDVVRPGCSMPCVAPKCPLWVWYDPDFTISRGRRVPADDGDRLGFCSEALGEGDPSMLTKEIYEELLEEIEGEE